LNKEVALKLSSLSLLVDTIRISTSLLWKNRKNNIIDHHSFTYSCACFLPIIAPVPNTTPASKPKRAGCSSDWPSPKRTRPYESTHIRVGTGGSSMRALGHGFPPNARENSKYPKGTPLVPNFSYLSHSTFHIMSNMRLKSFYSFLSPFSYWIRPTFDLNISFGKEIEHVNIPCVDYLKSLKISPQIQTSLQREGRIFSSNANLASNDKCGPESAQCSPFNAELNQVRVSTQAWACEARVLTQRSVQPSPRLNSSTILQSPRSNSKTELNLSPHLNSNASLRALHLNNRIEPARVVFCCNCPIYWVN